MSARPPRAGATKRTKRDSFYLTPEEIKAKKKYDAQLEASTDAAIIAAVDAIKSGGDAAAAAREATARFFPPRAAASGAGIPADALPRLSGEGWNAERQREFLVHLAQNGCIGHACAHVGLSRQSAYALRRRAPNSVFAIGWDVAIEMARQALLDEATERAFLGREVPVWYHGEQVGTRVVHNDRLLMFLLGQRREPIHPALDARELTHLFPALLKMVDAILPPAFSAERIAELTGASTQDAEDEEPWRAFSQ